jgi:hypothetical protein
MGEIKLRNIPTDVVKVLVRKQGEIKLTIGHNRYSLESTVYKIIREWRELKKKVNEG